MQVNLGKRGEVTKASEAAVLNEMPGMEPSKARSEFYATHEKTVEGECETLYTVVANPASPQASRDVLNVTRTIQFENCKTRPEVKYNFRFQDPCDSCEPKFKEDVRMLLHPPVADVGDDGGVVCSRSS